MTARVHPAPLAATRSGSVVRSWTALTCRLRGGRGAHLRHPRRRAPRSSYAVLGLLGSTGVWTLRNDLMSELM